MELLAFLVMSDQFFKMDFPNVTDTERPTPLASSRKNTTTLPPAPLAQPSRLFSAAGEMPPCRIGAKQTLAESNGSANQPLGRVGV